MSDWETVTPQRRESDGWETVSPESNGGSAFVGAVRSAASDFTKGGPAGILLGMTARGIKNASDIVDKTANEAGGHVTDFGAKLGLAPETAAKFGLAANVGIQTVPALLSGNIASKVATPTIENAANSLMVNAVKANTKESWRGGAKNIAQTLIDNGIAVTEGGLSKLRAKVSGLNDDIAAAINSSTATVNKNAVAARADDVLDKAGMQVSPTADTKAVNTVINDFLNHPLISGTDIGVRLAQKLKQGTYQALSKKYGQLGSAETEAQKALARGLKEEIATAVPAVSRMNAEESKLLAAMTPVERRVIANANKDIGGLAWLAHSPTTAMGFWSARSPAFKSYLALAMDAGSEVVPKVAGSSAYGAMEAAKQKNNQ